MRQLDAATLKTIDKDIDVLVVVHPKQLPDDAQYAIDQFVLRGGHLLVFVDPNRRSSMTSGADPNNPQAAMMADKSSDLPKLFKAWGIEYDPHKVVLDRAARAADQLGRGPGAGASSGHPRLHVGDINRDDVVTANLERSTCRLPATSSCPRTPRTKS